MHDEPSARTSQAEIDAEGFKEALAAFPTGVTVVTVALDGRLHGMTANAFTAVSLNPPLVLVCVERAARMHGLIPRAGAFAVNILSDDQEALSAYFARRGRPLEGEFDGLAHALGVTGAPTLGGAAATIECTMRSAYDGGDHTIYVGAVRAVQAQPARRPLLYHRRRYPIWAHDDTVSDATGSAVAASLAAQGVGPSVGYSKGEDTALLCQGRQ